MGRRAASPRRPGGSYIISIASGKTMTRDRRQWRAIPVFIVIVDRFIEET
jgi:hypothetical protein